MEEPEIAAGISGCSPLIQFVKRYFATDDRKFCVLPRQNRHNNGFHCAMDLQKEKEMNYINRIETQKETIYGYKIEGINTKALAFYWMVTVSNTHLTLPTILRV